MTKQKIQALFESLDSTKNYRLTRVRTGIIQALEGKKLTFDEIYTAISEKGFINLASLYNNIHFFVTQKIVNKIHADNEEYYALNENLIYNDKQASNSFYVFVEDDEEENEKPRLIEVDGDEYFDLITQYLDRKNIVAKEINITVKGRKR